MARGLPIARAPVRQGELGGLPIDVTAEGDVRTLPCDLAGRGGLDGFFIARLRRHD
jgi:16S rRNA (cytosine967-C5)-methyltransferase